jgi:hypothetical protein
VQAALLRGVEISSRAGRAACFGDALLLRRAVDNLIDNADRQGGGAGCRSWAKCGWRPMDRGRGIAGDVYACCNRSSAASVLAVATGGSRTWAGSGQMWRGGTGELQLLHREGGGLIARLLLGKFPDIGCGLQAAAVPAV